MATLNRILLLIALMVLAAPAYAASLSIEAPLAAAGAPLYLPVVFSPGNDDVNVVEGSIALPRGIAVDSIDTSGSAFPLFAEGPTYMLSSHSVEFTAGAPGGLAPGTPALLFVIKARAETEGNYGISLSHVSSYKNDGEGTKVAVSAPTVYLSVRPKGTVNVDALPASAPAPLIAEVGNDASLFNGKWFVTFYGGASGSSVDHYEVREGWWRAPERAERYYVLKDQGLGSTLWITAVGSGGESVTVKLPSAHPWTERGITAALIIAILTVAGLVWRRFFRKPR